MGRNQKGGKKHKKLKNKNNIQPLRKELILADSSNGSQEYITITKMLGDGRCLGNASNGMTDVLCIIRGSMRKRIWIHPGDIVLASFRDFGNQQVADIIHKYNEQEIQYLKKHQSFRMPSTNNSNLEEKIEEDNDIGFTFEDL